MKKIFPVMVFCAKTVFAVLMIYALIFVLLTYGLTAPPTMVKEFNLFNGNYGKNPVWLNEATYSAINDLYDTLDQNDPDQMVLVAVSMYREALKKIALSKSYSTCGLGTNVFDAAGLGGEVINTEIRSVERIGVPTLSPNQPSKSYYQNIITAGNVTAEGAIKSIMETVITKGIREYIDGYNISSEIATKGIFIDQTGGGANWSGAYKTTTLKEYNKNGRQYEDETELKEISNLIINESSVLPKSVSIEKSVETIDEITQNYYVIEFNLDCSNPTTPGSAVYYEAESIRKQAGENFLKQLSYTEAKIRLKIYDNGYLTEWSMLHQWKAVFKVLFDISGGATMTQHQTFSYAPEDCVIDNFLKAA